MSERKSVSKKAIANWHAKHTDECGLGCDAADFESRCWRCGYEKELERCHIIPHMLGGESHPSNMVLLCHECHLEAPDVKDAEYMFDWIRNTNACFYDLFWHLRLAFNECMKDVGIHTGSDFRSSSKWVFNKMALKIVEMKKADSVESAKRLMQAALRDSERSEAILNGKPYIV